MLFAHSVDLINSERFNQVAALIDDYCRETLEIQSTKLYCVWNVEGRVGLKRFRLGGNEIELTARVRDDSGNYTTQTAMAFDRQRPLWIVSKTGRQQLVNADGYADKWSGLRKIPRFKPLDDGGVRAETRTSIIVPLPTGTAAGGVLNFETSEYVEITPAAKDELLKIADAVGHLLKLLNLAQQQSAGTEAAVRGLAGTLARPHPKLTKPKVFVASSTQANSDVIDTVLSVLQEDFFAARLQVIYWKDMDEPGNINRQLLDAIGSCRYAVCYFSQPGDDGIYRDNPNVVFEAGMFHGRMDHVSILPASWIPIREQQSETVPFDFAQERLVIPDRSDAGELRATALADLLRKRLLTMLRMDE